MHVKYLGWVAVRQGDTLLLIFNSLQLILEASVDTRAWSHPKVFLYDYSALIEDKHLTEGGWFNSR